MTGYIAHVWVHGTRGLIARREQVIVHRSEATCGGLLAANDSVSWTHPLSQTEVDHLRFVPNIIWPCKNCCRHLQAFVTEPAHESTTPPEGTD